MVANAVAALSEIAEASPHLQVMDMNSSTINKLLTALNECTEWGQVFILDCLSSYTPKDDREAQSTCERVTPRLAHANAAVVLSAVKVKIVESYKYDCLIISVPQFVFVISKYHSLVAIYIDIFSHSLIFLQLPST